MSAPVRLPGEGTFPTYFYKWGQRGILNIGNQATDFIHTVQAAAHGVVCGILGDNFDIIRIVQQSPADMESFLLRRPIQDHP